ncbi:LysR family transcriptional regulator [Gluconacetobacter tumulisoli]|uniref:LysR family transcriptional regulator n=1 Tax=Gluconacetobacter tumulisoli TaxID=1286189 RepID=A0A7W4PJT1_9PROT|nr:LysR family transcriptional regulator [Gluconacetobacter tumulisoli]MBB2200677.1 LysR family transcriptional regulator [Gluconacetobacter tumulisoli]
MRKIDLTDISRFDFNLLVTFLAIWQERSVTKAATRLSLSQSAVSTALTRLRRAAGDPLFLRTRGGMEPTPRAIAMAAQLTDGAAMIRDAFRTHAGFAPATCTRRFTLGMSDDFELAIGPLLSARLMSEAPGAAIVYRQANRYTAGQMLESGEIDVAIVTSGTSRSWMQREAIGEGGYACLFDPAACGIDTAPTLRDYLSLPHVLVSFSGREGIVDTALKAIGHTRRIQTALTHFSALPPFLAGSRVIATIPAHAANTLARISRLRATPVPVELGRYPIALAFTPATGTDAALSWLRGAIADALATGLAQAAHQTAQTAQMAHVTQATQATRTGP